MRVKLVDGELFLDRKTKVFFSDQIVPEEFKDPLRYDLVIIERHNSHKEKPNEKN